MTFEGAVVLSSDDDRFGGYSGLDISADGTRLIAVSDRATWLSANLVLDGENRLIGVSDAVIAEMAGQYGVPLTGGMGDAEAVARGPDGALYVSFERFPRVLRYRAGEVRSLPRPKIWKKLQFNSSFETLFFTEDGVLAVAAERSGAVKRPYPGWALRGGDWVRFEIPRDGVWQLSDAAVGPDGYLYVLERDFGLLKGVWMRLRRMTIAPDFTMGPPEVLVTLGPTDGIDNMEGLAVWGPADAPHLLLVSDDNFNLIQRTMLVKLRVR